MILFEQDWKKYPDAIADLNTPNRHFVRFCYLLKAMGVQNHLWPLALHNPHLAGLDPYDPNLTSSQKLQFVLEFRENPWAFFRVGCRAEESTPSNPFYFLPNRSNMAALWLYFNHLAVVIVQIRQTGKSFVTEILDTYLSNLRNKSSNVLLFTKDADLRTKTLRRIRELTMMLPEYCRMFTSKDISNNKQLGVESLKNLYSGIVAQADRSRAVKLGRGLKIDNVRVDELAFLSNLKISLSGILTATSRGFPIAKQMGNEYGMIFMTTAGDLKDPNGLYAFNFSNNSAPWTEQFYDLEDTESLRRVVRQSSKGGEYERVCMTFNHRQLGYTDEWLRETARRNDSEGQDFERDYLNRWTISTTGALFDEETIKRLYESEQPVEYLEISPIGKIATSWYLKKEAIATIFRNETTILSIDTSDALGKDDFALVYLRVRTGETLGVCPLNQINIATVAQHLGDKILQNPRMITIFERRNQATSIIDILCRILIAAGVNPFKRLFSFVVQDAETFPDRFSLVKETFNGLNETFVAQYKKYFGFATSSTGTTSRSALFGTTLHRSIRYLGDVLRDRGIISQIVSLENRGGRIDHPSGCRNDLCVAWLLGCWLMFHGKNLSFYGVEFGEVLSENAARFSPASKEDATLRVQAQATQRKIEEYRRFIADASDPLLISRALKDLEWIKTTIPTEAENVVTIDEILSTFKNNAAAKRFTYNTIF